jgi:hypothetical protein
MSVASLEGLFPRYDSFSPKVPVWCVTSDRGPTIHRFFDTSPISPSGRYLALTELPFEDRIPLPGELAAIVLVDLESGESHVVAETRGWDTQLGAQVQWGVDDHQLFFNDVDTGTWRPFGVMLDPTNGTRSDLQGTVYMASADGRTVASPCLRRIGRMQPGYGVLVPPPSVPVNRGAPKDDGLYVTDTSTGATQLLVSIEECIEALRADVNPGTLDDGDFYCSHVKWNPPGDRLMLVLRWVARDTNVQSRRRSRLLPRIPIAASLMSRLAAPLKRWRTDGRHKGRRIISRVLTLKADGSDLRLAVPAAQWIKGGHHPNWCPDGEHLTMNLKLDGNTMRFVKVRYDGSDLQAMTHAVVGSGHPTLHPDGSHVVTDAYLHEPFAFGDGTTPIRWINVKTGDHETLVRIRTLPRFHGVNKEFRVDAHPAWDRAFRRIVFNACPDGIRRVFVADLSDSIHQPFSTAGIPNLSRLAPAI